MACVSEATLLDCNQIKLCFPKRGGLEYFAESLRNFRGQLDGMLELYFEPLTCRNAEAYAEAYATYFTNMAAAGGLFFPEQEFEQSFPAQLCFVPTAHPTEEGKVLLAEKAEFRYLSHFPYLCIHRCSLLLLLTMAS